MAIDKKSLLQELKERLSEQLEQAKTAYDTSHQHATSTELKSEGKYDTRSIEAGYIAGAQKKRVDELEMELKLLDEVSLDHPTDKVSVGSLVELETNGLRKFYFISSTSGGSMIQQDKEIVLVISAFSPIGQEVIGLMPKDSFEVEAAGNLREYEVISIH